MKSLKTFTEDVLVPFVAGNQEITLFIDEIHAVDKNVLNWLLSIIPASDEIATSAVYNGMRFDFNYHVFSFLSASTNPEKLIEPLKTRMRRIELDNYTTKDIVEIVKVNAKKNQIILKDQIEEKIADVSRFTPRTAVYLMKDIVQYCKKKNNDTFTLKDWNQFETIFQILPFGIQSSELRILRKLAEFGPQKLSTLAADLMLDPTTVRRDIERFLLGHGLISIDVKRSITARGIEVMNKCERFLNELNNTNKK